MNVDKVTRVEVIDYNNPPEEGARDYVKYDIDDVELSLQDSGRTLKVFLNSPDKISK